jgi:hypothetical protein
LKLAVSALAALWLALAPGTAAAKTKLLQSVEVWGMSTDGGEAHLRLTDGLGRPSCSIDAVILGESGRNEYAFAFRKELFAATSREYSYSVPYYMDPNFKTRLAKTTTLKSAQGRVELRRDFRDFRKLFRKSALAQCAGL